MAYDKTERFPKLISQTPADIGPGTYEILDSPRCSKSLGNYPFLSGTKRTSFLVSKESALLPGPGSHYITESHRHIPENFTDARFKRDIREGPGPTEYDLRDKSFGKCHEPRSHPGTWRGPAGKLWFARPPRSIIPSGVSVPTKHDENGYEIENGVLVKIPPDRCEPPFFYDVPREETNFNTLRYKGNFWSRMTGRSDTQPFLTPGPGDYEHETRKTPAQIRDEKIREERRATSKQLRYLDALNRTTIREDFPAPNAYKPKGTFDKYFKISCKCDPYALEPPPFGHTAKRFEDKSHSNTPGPGAHTPEDRIKCFASIYPAPFGACAGRFEKVSDDTGPAPGYRYCKMGDVAYESAKRFKCRYKKTSDPGYIGRVFTRERDGGRGAEDYGKLKETRKCKVYHAAFKSRTKRFPDMSTGFPEPGTYESSAAFKANRDRCDFHSRRLPTPFGTRSDRFPKIPPGIDIHVPGVSRYNITGDIAENIKGGVISYPREIKEKTLSPSPAQYCIHPYLTSSVLKKSFNTGLGKPEAIKELLEKEKQNSQFRRRHMKKTLRWFAQPLKEYKHCFTICI